MEEVTNRYSVPHLLVYDDMNLHALFSLALEETIQAPFREIRSRTAKIQLRGKPPVLERGQEVNLSAHTRAAP